MTRQQFSGEVSNLLRLNDVRKEISVPKKIFHISDDEGNTKTFAVKGVDKAVLYNISDVDAIIDACIFVIKEALKRGDSVNFKHFGKFTTQYRKSKKIYTYDGRVVDSKPRYYPHFSPAKELKTIVELHETMLEDQVRDVEDFFPEPEEEE